MLCKKKERGVTRTASAGTRRIAIEGGRQKPYTGTDPVEWAFESSYTTAHPAH